jgi:hypothetical protein
MAKGLYSEDRREPSRVATIIPRTLYRPSSKLPTSSTDALQWLLTRSAPNRVLRVVCRAGTWSRYWARISRFYTSKPTPRRARRARQSKSEHCNPSGDPPTAAPRCRNALISLLGTYWRASHIEANMVPLSCPSPGLEGDPCRWLIDSRARACHMLCTHCKPLLGIQSTRQGHVA